MRSAQRRSTDAGSSAAPSSSRAPGCRAAGIADDQPVGRPPSADHLAGTVTARPLAISQGAPGPPRRRATRSGKASASTCAAASPGRSRSGLPCRPRPLPSGRQACARLRRAGNGRAPRAAAGHRDRRCARPARVRRAAPRCAPRVTQARARAAAMSMWPSSGGTGSAATASPCGVGRPSAAEYAGRHQPGAGIGKRCGGRRIAPFQLQRVGYPPARGFEQQPGKVAFEDFGRVEARPAGGFTRLPQPDGDARARCGRRGRRAG